MANGYLALNEIVSTLTISQEQMTHTAHCSLPYRKQGEQTNADMMQ